MGVAELDTPEARSTHARGVEDRCPSPGAQPRPPTALPLSLSSPRTLGPCDLPLGSHSPASLRDFLTPVGKSTVRGASPLGLGLHLLQVPHRSQSVGGFVVRYPHTPHSSGPETMPFPGRVWALCALLLAQVRLGSICSEAGIHFEEILRAHS